MENRKICDAHVHLGRSNGINATLHLGQLDNFIEKFDIENLLQKFQTQKKLMKSGTNNTMQMDFYIDISQNTERNFVEDVLVPLLRLINADQSIRIEDMPTKYTKRKLTDSPEDS